MKITLRKKILGTCLLLALLIILATSGLYYWLMTRDIRERSQQQIRRAFEMIFDGIVSQAEQMAPRVENAIEESLASSMYFMYRDLEQYQDLKEFTTKWDNADTQTWIYIQGYLIRLKNVVEQIHKIAPELGIHQFIVYDRDRKAIALYHHLPDQDMLGMYLYRLRGGVFVAMQTEQDIEAISRWVGVQDIRGTPLPEDIVAEYPGEIPMTTLAELSCDGDRTTIKFASPVFRKDTLNGFCVLHLDISQRTVERYARFSQTQINLFAGTSLSVGTLPEYQTLSVEAAEIFAHIDLLNSETIPAVGVSNINIHGHEYYQGKLLFQDETANRGGITINVARQIEIDKAKELLTLIGLVTLGLSVITAIISFALSKRIVRPVTQLAEYAKLVGSGRLDVNIPDIADDEIGDLAKTFHGMTQNLNMFIGQVQQSGIQVTSSATQLSATAKQQETTVSRQMESMKNIVQSVNEIASVLVDLVETMQLVASKSEETAEFASSGQTELSLMGETMRQMEGASLSISERLKTINEKADNITTVVTTINKVADQTNLLSLNAAIEAEKAGEYGRGFTVVAREIRRLADQTAVATLDIEQMVQEMQSAVNSGVMEMDKFIAEVRHGVEVVGKISAQLTRIIEQVQTLTPSFEQVNVTMQQQSNSAQAINTAIAYLSQEMEETKNALQETFSSIEQLKEAARNLQDQVSRFKVS